MRDAIEETHALVRDMKIRGAGRIARVAVLALKEYCDRTDFSSVADLLGRLQKAGQRLKSARPTAVSLPNAVNLVVSVAKKNAEKGLSLPDLKQVIDDACDNFVAVSDKATQTIAAIGAKRITDGDVVMTHCNSEAVTEIFATAHAQGKSFEVYATETRPRYQGRITAADLARRGIDVSLIPDSAARLYMHKVDKVLVGADAIAANGAVVNKIGTSQLALVAHESRARFYVAAETYKLHPTTMLGELVEIEQRSSLEVVPRSWMESNGGVKVKNPAFDVTPPEYIDIIITERGIYPPQGIVFLMKELYPET
ncbi:MAG: ribose 1,5-bisphosphate isomerase [Nitrososphaerota archaeon]|nr:ribose 1,5-bisphosphate isomerase [Nitrososphaerota archaeon]